MNHEEMLKRTTDSFEFIARSNKDSNILYEMRRKPNAKDLRLLYEEYVLAGFSNKQAFELIKLEIQR